MKRNWDPDELIEHFTFLPNEMQQVGKKTGETRLGFAVLFKFFQYEARFPSQKSEVPKVVVQFIARRIGVPEELFALYDWGARTITYHRTQIREFFGFSEDTAADAEEMIDWLNRGILLRDHNYERLAKAIYQRFRELKIVPPKAESVEELINIAVFRFEERFFQDTLAKLPASALPKIDSLINNIKFPDEDGEDQSSSDSDEIILSFHDLKADPGKPGVESALREVCKLRTIRNLGLPDNLFGGIT